MALWISTVFQPLNLEIEKTIVQNSPLIVGDEMPRMFQRVIAQTEAYKAVIASWSPSDRDDPATFTAHDRNTVPGLNYPDGIVECVAKTYVMLKARQSELPQFSLRNLKFWSPGTNALQAVAACNAG